ncbi:hypothetical protein [Pseudostreptobacillus hongkongensis]|uniref:hypothetical protein n=1 Tax=Pseudostreptobacillus hongkongensis TaxID=1162717 RepID=UPI0028D5EA5F|nr:hypothetical protein [Pseudostreptobacillus hongkongensis]
MFKRYLGDDIIKILLDDYEMDFDEDISENAYSSWWAYLFSAFLNDSKKIAFLNMQ